MTERHRHCIAHAGFMAQSGSFRIDHRNDGKSLVEVLQGGNRRHAVPGRAAADTIGALDQYDRAARNL